MNPIFTNDEKVKEIAKVGFPSYNGRIFKISKFEGPMELRSYWDGGSRDYYAIVDLRTMRTAEIPQGGSGHGDVPYKITSLPEGMAVVEHTYFSGKDLGLTVFVGEENMNKLLPSGENELSWAEKVVLSATRSLKSSYAGIKDYRFREALRNTGITKKEWDEAKQSLISKKMLNAAGAITNDGRNAIGNTNLWALERGKEIDDKTS